MGNEVRLKQVMADVFKVDTDSIDDMTSVDSIEKWDSLNHLNLVIALEMEFDINFTEEQSVEILNYPLIKIVLEEHGVRM